MIKKAFLTLLIVSGTVFFSNACIMIVELVASRLIARHLGSSLYTWTSIIGIVLAGISVGNYIGGRLADRYQPRKTLSVLFMLASVACVTIIILNNIVGEWIWLWQLSWPVRVFSHVSLVFLVPSVLLGTISPVAATMALKTGLPTGRTIGDIYAWGTAGSIVGTFLAGFFLIATLGTVMIIWVIAGALLVMGIIYYARMWVLYIWAIIFVLLLTLGMAPYEKALEVGANWQLREEHDPTILYQDETQYCWVAIKQVSADPDHRLFMQDKLKHSEIIMDDLDDLQYFHTQIFDAVTRQLSQDKNTISVFSIGGGGYVFPQYIEKHWPGSRNDVAEIDPGITKAAIEAFGLSPDSSINTIQLDARNYVDSLLTDRSMGKETPLYDFIYEDAFSDYNVPFQLVTKEFNDKIFDILTDEGVYMINMIDVLDKGGFLPTYLNTLQQTFPYLYVATQNAPASIRATFSIIASKIPVDIEKAVETFRPAAECRFFDTAELESVIARADDIVLTDDFAPVENLLANAVRQSARELLAAKYMEIARRLKSENKLEECLDYYRLAAQENESITILAYNEIGTISANQGKSQDAIDAFTTAIDYYYNNPIGAQKVIGSLHLNLGILLGNLGRSEKAVEQLALAVERLKEEIALHPQDPELYSRMGDAHAMMAQFKEASDAFAAALRLEPTNHHYYGNLIRSLELQGRIDEAIVVIKQQIMLLNQQGNRNAAAQLEQYLSGLQQRKK
jgi:spermidine synthase